MAVEEYIYNLENENQKMLMTFFHRMFKNLPNVTPKIAFKIPFYYQKTWVCYLSPIKPDAVEVCFLRGNELSNEQGILEAKKRVMVMGVTFNKIDKEKARAVEEIFLEALELERTIKFKARKKNRY